MLSFARGVGTVRHAPAAKMFTVRALASAPSCSSHTVYEVERSKRTPHFETVRRLSTTLGDEQTETTEFRRALLIEGDTA